MIQFNQAVEVLLHNDELFIRSFDYHLVKLVAAAFLAARLLSRSVDSCALHRATQISTLTDSGAQEGASEDWT